MTEQKAPVEPLTKTEIAALWGVNEKTVDRWVDMGMPHFRPPGETRGTIRFDRNAVVDWMNRTDRSPEDSP